MPLTHLEITSDTPYADGEAFGDTGPYRELKGTAHFAVDPDARVNSTITDIGLAPTDSEGRVRFSSHFALLIPAEPGRGNRRLFFDVCQQGQQDRLQQLQQRRPGRRPCGPAGSRATASCSGTATPSPGAAGRPTCLPTPGLIGMQAPHAMGPDGPTSGRIMNWFQVDEPTTTHMLSDREHLPHPAADPYESIGSPLRPRPSQLAPNADRPFRLVVREQRRRGRDPRPHGLRVRAGAHLPARLHLIAQPRGRAGVRGGPGRRLVPEVRGRCGGQPCRRAARLRLRVREVPERTVPAKHAPRGRERGRGGPHRAGRRSLPTSPGRCAASSTCASASHPRTSASSCRSCSRLQTHPRSTP